MEHQLSLDEGDRQLLLLAMAVLSLENPGFDYALNEIAKRIDNVVPTPDDTVQGGRAKMYDEFRVGRRKPVRQPATETKDPKAADELMLVGLTKQEATFAIAGLHHMLAELEKQTKQKPIPGSAFAKTQASLKLVLDHGAWLYERMKGEFEETFDEVLQLEGG
jgi:hypothetical protein